MITMLQIALLLSLIALIGIIIGYLFGKLSCKRAEDSQYFQKNSYCEGENALYNPLMEEANKSIIEDNNQEENINENKEENITQNSQPMLLKEPKNGQKDNLCKIKGIGVVIEEKLNNLGIFHFEQIASWQEEEIAWVDKHLAFSGRIIREDWIGQAKKLAAGQETEFSKRVAKGEVASSKKD